MASLSYMIYKANVQEEEATKKAKQKAKPAERKQSIEKSDRAHDLYSSFRRKSTLVDPSDPRKQWVSMGTVPPKPPKLRDLIREAGIIEELENDPDMKSLLEEEIDDFSAVWSMVDKPVTNVIDQALKEALEEVLTMDDQEPIPCTCWQGKCVYHPSDASSSEVVSIPSRSASNGSAFEEIPVHCVPQFEPEYLTPAPPVITHEEISIPSKASNQSSFQEIPVQCVPQFEPQYLQPATQSVPPPPTLDFQKFSPPPVEPLQPSRSALKHKPPSSGRPPRATHIPKEAGPEEDEDIYNSSHIPSSIRRFDSFQSYHTMVSEITVQSEMKSLRIDPRAPQYQMALEQKNQGFLNIDPRAPQYQMALEQQRMETGEVTERANNHTAGSPCPPTRRQTPTQGESPNPPMRKQTPPDPYAQAPTFEFPIHEEGCEEEYEEEAAMHKALARKGTVGGPSGQQPASQPQGPFSSPKSAPRRMLQVPSTPQQDSNPLLYPSNLMLSPDASISQKSISGPFVSPRAQAPRRAHQCPNTPKHDSNPLLFPQGLGYYPPSPCKLPQPPNRMVSPANSQTLPKTKAKLPSLLPPLDTGSDENSGQSALQRSIQSSTAEDESEQHALQAKKSSMVRVKLSPAEITYIIDGQKYVHTGFYSGPLNSRGVMHGNGVFWFTTGDLYLGQFYDGKLHGIGAISIKVERGTKQIFKGHFRSNEFIGEEEEGEGVDHK